MNNETRKKRESNMAPIQTTMTKAQYIIHSLSPEQLDRLARDDKWGTVDINAWVEAEWKYSPKNEDMITAFVETYYL